jgi:hypothetical protein
VTPLELTIILLVVTVALLLFTGLALAVYHYPQLVQPVMVGLTGLALLVAALSTIASLKP